MARRKATKFNVTNYSLLKRNMKKDNAIR
jgi:hypothetical protein